MASKEKLIDKIRQYVERDMAGRDYQSDERWGDGHYATGNYNDDFDQGYEQAEFNIKSDLLKILNGE